MKTLNMTARDRYTRQRACNATQKRKHHTHVLNTLSRVIRAVMYGHVVIFINNQIDIKKVSVTSLVIN